MTNQEYEILKRKIERVMDKLDELQKLYEKETGREFVHPFRLKPLKRRK